MKTRRSKNEDSSAEKDQSRKAAVSKIPKRSRKVKAKPDSEELPQKHEIIDINQQVHLLEEPTELTRQGSSIGAALARPGRKSKKTADYDISAGDGKRTRGRKRLVVECEPLESVENKRSKVSSVEKHSDEENNVDKKTSRRGTFTMSKPPKVDDRRGTFTINKPPKLSNRRGTFTVAKLEEMAISEEDDSVETTDTARSEADEKADKIKSLPVTSDTGKKGDIVKFETIKTKKEKAVKVSETAAKGKDLEGTKRKEKSAPAKASKKKAMLWDEDIIDLVLKDTNLKKTLTKGDKFMGAHVSIVGGLWNAVHEAVHLGARSFAMFLKSQRTWNCKPLKDEDAEKFKHTLKMYGFSPSMVVPHGSYLMNCGAPNADTLAKSRAMLIEELQRCDRLGLDIFNFHPGSTCGQITVEECLQRIAESINQALKQSTSVAAVIENMSCQGHTVGGKFTELRRIIDLVEDKSRIGICLDTCHAFAAGYDLHTEAGFNHMMSDLEDIVGLEYLKALHINDSKGAVGCHLDRHENIGKGHIGIDGFERIMNDPRFNNIPMILETPEEDYSIEIKLLNKLIK